MTRLRLAGVAFAGVLALAATVVGVAAADPSKGSDPLLYEFTDCSDGSSFEAIKQRRWREMFGLERPLARRQRGAFIAREALRSSSGSR